MNRTLAGIVSIAFLGSGIVTANAWAETPFIDIVSPPSAVPGSGPLSLTIGGANFISGAIVNFNGAKLTPDSLSMNKLHVTVPAASLAKAGTAAVAVVNPEAPPLDGISNIVLFPIDDPLAALSFADKGSFPNLDTSHAVVGDFTGDGNLDIAVCNPANGDIVLLTGDGTGNFVPVPSFLQFGFCGPAAAGDFNGDGKLDLAIYLGPIVAIFLGDGTGHFTFHSGGLVGRTTPRYLAVGDFNGDGFLDVAAIGGCFIFNCTGDAIDMFFGDGAGNLIFQGFGRLSFISTGVAEGDFNGDGKLDLVVLGRSSPTSDFSLLEGDGTGNFTLLPGPSISPQPPVTVAVADFDGDGTLDLAFGTSRAVRILLGDGAGNFRIASAAVLGSDPLALAVGDFNGDGKLDVAVTTSNNAAVLLGDGAGSLSPGFSGAVSGPPPGLAVGDFNNDGRLDLLAFDLLLETGGASLSSLTIEVNVNADFNSSVPPPATFNIDSEGAMYVAILGSHIFDVTTIDPTSARFGPNGALNVRPPFFQDVNSDGIPDLILSFVPRDAGFGCYDTVATLTGQTYGKQSFSGSETVHTTHTLPVPLGVCPQ